MADILTPFVYWAQTESQITLKVDLTDVKDERLRITKGLASVEASLDLPNINLCSGLSVDMEERKLRVAAHGQGARGLNNYGFNLDLHSSINTEKFSSAHAGRLSCNIHTCYFISFCCVLCYWCNLIFILMLSYLSVLYWCRFMSL